MTLSFDKHNVTERKFVEKIWASIIQSVAIGEELHHHESLLETCDHFGWDEYYLNTAEPFVKPKIHTIREDKSDRWKAGNDIHFVINNRTPERFQFAPVVECVCVQEIVIDHSPSNPGIVRVTIEKKLIYEGSDSSDRNSRMWEIARNDGFDSVEDFFTYFDKSFTGKIIHWTEKKY